MSFADTLKAGIAKLTHYVEIAINLLVWFKAFMPGPVQFMIDAVAALMDAVQSKAISPADAREQVVSQTLAKFSGSEPITEQQVRMLVEAAVTVEKAKRGHDDSHAIQTAIDKGYVIPEELEKARKGWPGILPIP